MADIKDLKLGTRVQYRDPQGRMSGVIVGRRINGRVEGDLDPDASHDLPRADRIKVAFATIGVPPETRSITCAPDAVELDA